MHIGKMLRIYEDTEALPKMYLILLFQEKLVLTWLHFYKEKTFKNTDLDFLGAPVHTMLGRTDGDNI